MAGRKDSAITERGEAEDRLGEIKVFMREEKIQAESCNRRERKESKKRKEKGTKRVEKMSLSPALAWSI